MWFNKGDQNSLESGLKSPKGHELCRRLHPNDSRNPFSFTVVPQGVMVGEGARRRRRMDVPRRGTLLRSGQYDNSAKRDFVSSFRAKREIFVTRGLAVNDWKFQTGNLLSTYLRASPHIYCSEAATTTLNPEPSSLFENAP